MNEKVIISEGIFEVSEFDKSSYSDDHDVPALYIGGQIIELGDGYLNEDFVYPPNRDEESFRWKLEEGKKYRVTIEEIE